MSAANPSYLVNSRLGEDWSAERFQIKPEVVSQLTEEAFAALDPLVKTRLLLAAVMAGGRARAAPAAAHQAAALGAQLRRLRGMALADDDAWVKVAGAAAGEFDGRLDMPALCAANAKVRATVSRLEELAGSAANGHLYPPLEDDYLAPPGWEHPAAQAAKDAAAAKAAEAAAAAADGQEAEPPQPRRHFAPRPAGEVPARSRPRVPRAGAPVSPTGLARQGSMLARRGTSTGEGAAFRDARAAAHTLAPGQRGGAAAGHHGAEAHAGGRAVRELDSEEAARLGAGAAVPGAAHAQPKPRRPLQLKKGPGPQQQRQQQEEEGRGARRPAPGLAFAPEGPGASDEPEEGEPEGAALLRTAAARMADWGDDDSDGEGGLAAAAGAAPTPAAARRPAPRAALARARRGRLAAGGARLGGGGGGGEAADAALEDDVGPPTEAPRGAHDEAQMRDLFGEDEEEGDGAAAAAGQAAGPPASTAAAAAAAAEAPASGGKAKRRRAVISDDEDE
ncbi:hypothetical protein Rsub_09620 [Raphidocelis subcapitata]|uniref:Uncharacterized protein n=1 Tax=Raphidocelis subcapitata TaxID=307507 RepID=A0A2V0PA86_9CHLO|nr:hypothetical protein Rsub_09620 [Raphidocelis subcapitata]|eukprot:GBF96764.1 hypothetical protein Rsub_09620 [Raphidocelis subcapitata]